MHFYFLSPFRISHRAFFKRYNRKSAISNLSRIPVYPFEDTSSFLIVDVTLLFIYSLFFPSQAKTLAEQLAAKLNTRLNYQPKEEEEKEEEEEVETFHKYEEELEINDFPQQARWRVTSKVIFLFS